MYKKILIGVDNSINAKNAQTKGIELAQLLHAEIGLVNAIDNHIIANIDTGITFEDMLAMFRKESEDEMKAIQKAYPSTVFSIFCVEGNPKEVILNVIDQWGADLMVLGSHGKSKFNDLFIGSVSKYILQHAKIPVMIAH